MSKHPWLPLLSLLLLVAVFVALTKPDDAGGRKLPGAELLRKFKELKQKKEGHVDVRVVWTSADDRHKYGDNFKYVVQQRDPATRRYKDAAEVPAGVHESLLRVADVRPSKHRYRLLVVDAKGERHRVGSAEELRLNEGEHFVKRRFTFMRTDGGSTLTTVEDDGDAI